MSKEEILFSWKSGRPQKKTFISQLNQNFRREFTENRLKKGSNFRKTTLFTNKSIYGFWDSILIRRPY
jgi:hypothetical protein